MHRTAGLIAFVSGFVALGYEILWARRLADLVGATALASGLVVAVFFLMLAAGAAWLGPRIAKSASPWRAYAWLEVGILLAILPAFAGDRIAGGIASALGDALMNPTTSLALKTFLALVFVGPASFLMGGTLPALGQAVVRAGALGRDGNVLYGLNTLGGATGILVATFVLLPAVGMRGSFGILMLGSAALALAATWMSRRAITAPPPPPPPPPQAASVTAGVPAAEALSSTPWTWLAFLSGFQVLGFEMLSFHLFAQVLHNSTYTFAAVLLVVITTLAAGALVTQRWKLDAEQAAARLALILLACALAIALVPRLFLLLTHGMQPFGGGAPSLAEYVLRALGATALIIGPAFVLAGWVFPLVLAGIGAGGHGAVAARWGRLLGFNATGALLGLVLANFVCMRALGLWTSLALWALPALTAGILLASRCAPRMRRVAYALAFAALVALASTLLVRFPIAGLAAGDRILAWNAGPDGVAAVISNDRESGDRRIKWNNTYTLGGVSNAAQQARMGHLALLLHPAPRRTAFIGIATGITASAALRDPAVASVVSVELSPQVARLACDHFADANANLCSDARSRIVVEDGRLFFRATRDTFDVVVGDLFVPWQAGTSNLYTREQFEAVRAHLAPGGVFAQWLPLFQLDATGFWGIAATFTSVFPNAWLALADFQPNSPAIALIGWHDAEGGPAADVLAARCAELRAIGRLREPMLASAPSVAMFLVGPVAPSLPGNVPPITLDHPWLDDYAPRVQRAQPPRWFVGPSLVATLAAIAQHAPNDSLRPAIQLGQQLFGFSEVLEREGPDRAAAWYDAHVTQPLPATSFRVDQPGRMHWPFTMPAGMFLLGRARDAAD